MDATWEYLSGDWYSSSRALLGLIIKGAGGQRMVIDLGDSDNVELTFDTTKMERFRKNTTKRILGRSDVNQFKATANLTLLQLPPIMRAAQFMGTPGQYLEQAANAAPDPVEVLDYEVGRVVLLPNNIFNATITSVTLGAAVLDPDQYRFDKMIGGVQVPRSTGLASDTLEIVYEVPEVDATAKRQVFGIGQDSGLRAGLIARQVNPFGTRQLVIMNQGLITPTRTPLVGGDEYDTFEFTMELEADETQPAGFEIGYVRDISDVVLAA